MKSLIRRLLIMFISFSLGLINYYQISATSSTEQLTLEQLSLLSDKECLNQLINLGFTDNGAYDTQEQTANAAKMIIKNILTFEKISPAKEYVSPFNYPKLIEMSEQIYKLLDDNNLLQTNAYSLKDSTQYGSWQESYRTQNCYGYALDKMVIGYPGYYSNGSYSSSQSIAVMADSTIADLENLGCTAYKTTTKPSGLNNFQHVICIRKGSYDFHYMKGFSSNLDLWRHKPGSTNPLTWNYISPGYKVWTGEYSIYNIDYSSDVTYTSTVYYVVYWLSNIGNDISE